MINSSHGNEDLITKYKEKIGKDVVANQIIGSVKIAPIADGVEITNVVCSDPGGLIPDFVKKTIAKRQTNNARFLVDYLLNGVVPEQI